MTVNADNSVPRSEAKIDAHTNNVDARSLAGLTIAISPRRICQTLAVLVLGIVIMGLIANIVIYNVAPSTDHAIAKLMNRFDLGHEPSIPSWYSSIALLFASALLGLIAHVEKLAKSADRSRWLLLSVVFMFLALDEAVMIHEMADAPMQQWLNTGGLLYFAWVIPYSLLVLALGAYLLPFLLRLEPTTRRLFVVAGVMFVGGAIGVESIEGVIVDRYGVEGGFRSMQLTFAQALEESLEMFAVVIFIYALLDHLKRTVGELRLAS
ncbi:MAG: hypothetical protein HKN35_03625 [Woeseia sp.]|nr:hypothetical protein [Gammaproteobacteria bacterium]NNE59957.1 hypothetical protein [Woeseia sp.]NNL52282.1 hypothetical protein [Woeseiaceae bacterium]